MHGHMADTGTASILELGQTLQLPTEQSGALQQPSAIMLAMTARLYGRPLSAFQGPPPCCRQGISSVARSVAATCHPVDSQNKHSHCDVQLYTDLTKHASVLVPAQQTVNAADCQ